MSNKTKVSHGILVVLSAPSGCGKTSIVERLLKRHPDWIRSVSATTRPPRAGEKSGEDYLFLSKPEFEKMKVEKKLLEWAEIYGHFYGTPKPFITEQVGKGKVVLLTIDVQGSRQVKESCGKDYSLVSIFILPPSVKALRERLTNRKTETPDEIEKRISIAQDEIKSATMYDQTVINQNLDQAVLEVEEIVQNFLNERSKQ